MKNFRMRLKKPNQPSDTNVRLQVDSIMQSSPVRESFLSLYNETFV